MVCFSGAAWFMLLVGISRKKFETMSILQIILAILIPPLAVALSYGLSSAFWINLLLTILGIVPGIIHAFIVISR